MQFFIMSVKRNCLGMAVIVFSLLVWSHGLFAAETTPEGEIPAALARYVARTEDVFQWKLREKRDVGQGRLYDVDLTSQTWQGIVWRHVLHVHEPADLRYPQHVLLFVTGGNNGQRPGDNNLGLGFTLARLSGARVAVLYQVPNQPLLDGRREDDLITETWLKYLQTGDTNWPLLFPMVKSAVKAMDAVEALARTEWEKPVSGFVITGGSKRGWTSWLAPVADRRILATAPMVIDVLNFRPQMQHQLDTWGKYSEQIRDYTKKGLVKAGDETPREVELRRMMDPYTYRNALTLPKLLINGTNDRYWVVDAMQWYWDDLLDPKYVLQVPNAGHGLDGGRERAFATLAAFFGHVADGTPLPKLTWSYSRDDRRLLLELDSSVKPKSARLWRAYSPTKDFREAKWNARPMTEVDGGFHGQLPLPDDGHVAMFGELQFQFRQLPYYLTTVVYRQ